MSWNKGDLSKWHDHELVEECTTSCPAMRSAMRALFGDPLERLKLDLQPKPDGVWVSHYVNEEGVRLHASELEALRYAVGAGTQVTFVRYGESVTEAVNRSHA